ncbi:MAG: SCP2 sterol-binding domain-containing protein [Oscillospiraceae bacterium]
MAAIKKTVTKTAPATATAAEKKTTVKATTATKTSAPAEKKPAAKTTAKKAATAKKTTAKAPVKKAPKKPAVTIDTICKHIEKKLPKTVAFKDKIAVDIEVWGFEDGSNAKMYIEANEGKVTVSPYTYDEKDFRIAVSFANAKAFIDGKMTLKEMLSSPDFYAEGNIVAAIKLASIF